MTPKDAFNSGGQNPNSEIWVKDWYLMGCIFSATPVQHQGEVLIGMRIASVIDVASYYTMGYIAIPKPPTAMNYDDVIGLLTTVLKQHGPPKCGIVISHSCWLSSSAMLKDADIAPRIETLKNKGIKFGPMKDDDKKRIIRWVEVEDGLRCEFDPENMGQPDPRLVQKLVSLLSESWGKTTLAEFKESATKQMNGTIFQSLRIADGPRLALAICITGAYELNAALKIFQLEREIGRASINWSTSTLGDLIIGTASRDGFCYEAKWISASRPAAILFVATKSSKIQLLEKVFSL
jgi:hypothetical protein